MALLLTLCIIITLCIISIIVSYYFIFKHTGEQEISAFIPFYNTYVMYRMFWNPKLYMITLSSTILSNIRYPGLDERQALIVCILINSVAFGLNMAMLYKVSEAYGKPKKFSILLMFFPYIFLPFIAGSKVEPKLARPPKKKRKKEKVPLIYVPLGINDIAAAKFKKEKEKENSRKEE